MVEIIVGSHWKHRYLKESGPDLATTPPPPNRFTVTSVEDPSIGVVQDTQNLPTYWDRPTFLQNFEAI